MEELIRFRLVNDELNDIEFNQFIIECIKLKGRSLFTRALFKEYKKQPESIIPLTNITTNIINARKPTQNQQINSFNSLDQLPSILINKCASFLETYEYIQFGHTNRKIYKSIYYPISNIPSLSMRAFKKWPHTKTMKRFKNITDLSIDIDYFNEKCSSANKLLWKSNNKLNTIRISGNENDVFNMATNKQIDLTNVTKLRLIDCLFVTKSLCDLLTNFPKIEHLELDDFETENNEDFEHECIIKSMANIKHFSFSFNCPSASDIITALSHQLESLKLFLLDGFSYNESIKFPKLKELYFDEPNTHSEPCKMLEKITGLKTIGLKLIGYDEDDDEDIIHAQNFTNKFVNKVINNQSLLQYLRFKIDFDLLKVAMTQLESEMYSMIGNKTWKSDVLVIEFDIANSWKPKWMNNMYLNVMRLIGSLEKCKIIKDFKVIMKMKNKQQFDVDSLKMKEWLSKLEIIKEEYLISYQFTKTRKFHHFIFSISNKHNTIDVNEICKTVF